MQDFSLHGTAIVTSDRLHASKFVRSSTCTFKSAAVCPRVRCARLSAHAQCLKSYHSSRTIIAEHYDQVYGNRATGNSGNDNCGTQQSHNMTVVGEKGCQRCSHFRTTAACQRVRVSNATVASARMRLDVACAADTTVKHVLYTSLVALSVRRENLLSRGTACHHVAKHVTAWHTTLPTMR